LQTVGLTTIQGMSLPSQPSAESLKPVGSDDLPVAVQELTSLSFMQPSAAENFWRKGWVRGLLSGAALLLLCSFLLQVMVQERDRLAAQSPAWQGGLEQLCQVLGCHVSPLRQIESISIEGSSFQQVSPGLYRLGFTLKNSALVQLALPALELTVTDVLDQAIIRRVLLPSELQLDTLTLSAKSELQATLLLDLPTQNSPNGRVVGYRLLAFYP